MNIYLEQFFNMSLKEHLDILLPNDIFLVFWGCIIMLSALLFFGFLPIAVIGVIRDFINEKLGYKKKLNIVLDLISIVVVALINIALLNLYSGLRLGLNSEGILFNPKLRVLVNYAKNIGCICGILFSLLLNNKILRKWFENLGLKKIDKILFVVLLLLFIFVAYYFYYICMLI